MNSPLARPSPELLTKEELRAALNLPSVRMVEELMRKRRIPFVRLGHRTVRFSLERVHEGLRRLECLAIGDASSPKK